jgi:hypothetical protein
MNNPALRQEPRYEPASVIRLKQETSLIDWLKANNRLIARETQETDLYSEDESDDLSEIIGDDGGFDDDDDLDAADFEED